MTNKFRFVKELAIILFLIGITGFAQELSREGVSSVTTEVDFTQKEIFEKITTFSKEFLANEKIKLTNQTAGKSITLQGEADHKACVVNQKMGSKTCYKLIFEMQITTQDKSYSIAIPKLKAESERFPDADYTHWFYDDGRVIPGFESAVLGTSEYFQSLNQDFKQYIEEGDYW
ncbi:MAG: hypothetical protein Q4G27_09730 [Flavobacteriaceae bacterium]|nr:hypothetical protein [Flavobacteriaceae bacterium]